MKRTAVLFLTAALAVSSVPLSVNAQEDYITAEESVENGLKNTESVENEEDMSQPEEGAESGKEEETGEDSEKDEQLEEGMTPDEVPGEDQDETVEENPDNIPGDVLEEEPASEEGNITENPYTEKAPESEEPAEQAVTEMQELPKEKVRSAKPALTYQAHVQNEGWQNWRQESELAGTEGKYRRMEALRIKLQGGEDAVQGSVEYRAHVQDYGWMDWKKDGELAGTQGQSKRMEAIEIRLTGELAEQYDIYYRVHIQNYGWLDWVKNGAPAGSSALSSRMESCMIRLVEKGDPSPAAGTRGFIKAYTNTDLTYRGHVQKIGNTNTSVNGQIMGTIGKSLRLEAMTMWLDTADSQKLSGGIEYSAHVQNIGWQGFKKNGQQAGTQAKSLRMEAVKIRLTGEAAKCYDIYYRAHVQNFGWLGWAKNGQASGSEGYAYRMEALQIMLVPKTKGAPGSTSNAFKKKQTVPVKKTKSFSEALGFDGTKIVKELSAHQNDSYYLGTPYQPMKNPLNMHEILYPNGDRRADGYSGMNCTGFVAYVTQKCGGNLAPIGKMGLWGGACNASNWFRYFKKANVEYYTYNSVSALLKSGKAEQGDIIYCEPVNWNQPGADCHIGFFWGRTSSENRFWHTSTSPKNGNQISNIVPGIYPSYFHLVKMK